MSLRWSGFADLGFAESAWLAFAMVLSGLVASRLLGVNAAALSVLGRSLGGLRPPMKWLRVR